MSQSAWASPEGARRSPGRPEPPRPSDGTQSPAEIHEGQLGHLITPAAHDVPGGLFSRCRAGVAALGQDEQFTSLLSAPPGPVRSADGVLDNRWAVTAVGSQQGGHVVGWYGWGQQVALCSAAAEVEEDLGGGFGFDAFDDGVEGE